MPPSRLAPSSIVLAVAACSLASACAAGTPRLSAAASGGFALHDVRVHGLTYSERDVSSDSRESESSSGFDVDGDSEWRGAGIDVALWTDVVDVTGGVRARDFEGRGTTETALGLRWRVREEDASEPYLAVAARHTHGGSDESEYVNGWAFGGGCLLHVTEHLFLDVSLMFETTRGLGLSDDTDVVYGVGLGAVW